jgi:uncharacterized repeat protein (TIGR01451 family)
VTSVVTGLMIGKQFGTPQLQFGTTTTLTFTIANPPTSPALTGLTFTDTLPEGLAFIASATTPQCNGTVTMVDAANMSFVGGSLASGSECRIVVTVRSTGNTPGVLTNVSSPVSADGGLSSRNGATAFIEVGDYIVNPSLPADFFLCANLNAQTDGALMGMGGMGSVVMNGQTGNAYCHQIALSGEFRTSPAEIGVQSIIDLGVIHAVDVVGMLPDGKTASTFDSPVRICMRGSAGSEALFLDASTSARSVARLTPTVQGDYLCVDLTRAGTLVLVRGSSGLPGQQQQPPDLPNETPITGVCNITTIHSPLNLRSAPGTSASVITQLPYDLTLSVTARTRGWFKVIYLDGQGWVSAQYVRTTGDCG